MHSAADSANAGSSHGKRDPVSATKHGKATIKMHATCTLSMHVSFSKQSVTLQIDTISPNILRLSMSHPVFLGLNSALADMILR